MKQSFNQVTFIEIDEDRAGQRLDNFLIQYTKSLPKSHVYRIIRKGEVRVNKKRAKPMQKLEKGDIVRVPPLVLSVEEPTKIPANVIQRVKKALVFEDSEFIVLNKPSGLAVHGGSGLSHGLIEVARQAFERPKAELVHRLDKDTSGCILIAKHRPALVEAHQQLRNKQAKKRYLALLSGAWQGPKQKIVEAPLKKNVLSGGERMVEVSDDGKAAKTMFQLLKNFQDCCLVAAYPVTGRTHQIRVHAQYLGQPIIGDKKYGTSVVPAGLSKVPRLFLHANQMSLKVKGKPYFFDVATDEQWEVALAAIEAAYQ